MPSRLKTPCKGRKQSRCKSARKSCKLVNGIRRKYCRKTRNNRTRINYSNKY